jgi:hypothetical protein
MKKFLVLLIASFALVSAACGSGSDSKSDSKSSSTKSTGGSDATVAKGDPKSDFCDLARKFTKDFKDTTDASNTQDEAALFKDLRSAIDQLDKTAPSEIDADVKVVADSFRQSDDVLKKYDYDFTKVPQEEAAKISLDDPKITESSNRVESYFEKTCGIDVDGDGDTDGILATTTTAAGDVSTSGTDDTTETTAGD